MHRTPLPLAALAALALAGPATAGTTPQRPTAPIPVPAGEVQHTFRAISWETDVGRPWSRRVETWASASASRMVHRDAKTGALLSDCAETVDEIRCYSAEENEIIVTPSAESPVPILVDSWAREGALIRQQVDMGWFVFGEDTVFDGKPARQLEDTPRAPSDTESRHYVVAEPETLFPLRRVITGSGRWTGGVQHFTQTDVVERREVLAPSQVDLGLGAYPDARVKRVGAPGARAARKSERQLAIKRKASRKRSAAAKRRAAAKRSRARR